MAKRYPFSKKDRLKKDRDFKLIYQMGHSLANRELVLYWLPIEDKSQKLGISISHRVEKKASRRNRIKRLLREAYRLKRPELKKGVYLLVVVKVGAKVLDSFLKASCSLVSLLKQARLFQSREMDST